MTGPAEAVFDGVITPELVPTSSPSESMLQPSEASTPVETTSPPSPEDEAAALAKVQAFLNDTSLDSMLNLASDSLEQRTRSRFERGGS
jgi:diaminopimelate epimerase